MKYLLPLLFATFVPLPLHAQGLDHVKAHYTKFEYRIPMRDGTRLFTAVYVPKDDSKTYPMLLKRTPYNCKPYGPDAYPENLGPSPLFGKAGYIFVCQDVRGRWMSEGEFVHMRPHVVNKQGKQFDESSDTFDTIDWLIKHVPGHNGKVGQWGISYPGFYTVCGMIDAHPALVAVSPQAPVTDWFIGDDWHHNGAFFLPHIFNFLVNFGDPRPEPTKKGPHPFDHGTADGYEFFMKLGPLRNADEKFLKGRIPFWNEVMNHPNYDAYWQARNIRPHIKATKPAVMTVGGWFDTENLFGALETFKHAEKTKPASVNHLVMGPWSHGQWEKSDGDKLGELRFNAKTGEFYREKIEFPFFEYHLKGEGKSEHPKAWVFETGTNRWLKFAAWPPAEAKGRSFYLSTSNQLSDQAPKESAGFDEYLSDPAKPVPFIEKTAIGMTVDYMTADQRFASRRPDVLVYQSRELDEDLTVTGPIDIDLWVSSTGSDADFIVKVIDVFPADYPDPNPNPTGVRMGGYQMLVRGDVFRAKFRHSFEKPEALKPGEPTRLRFQLPDACHTFRPGHRVMVQVQSSWFPIVDRNPQSFVDIYQAKESDFQKATQRVYREAERASGVTMRVLPTP